MLLESPLRAPAVVGAVRTKRAGRGRSLMEFPLDNRAPAPGWPRSATWRKDALGPEWRVTVIDFDSDSPDEPAFLSVARDAKSDNGVVVAISRYRGSDSVLVAVGDADPVSSSRISRSGPRAAQRRRGPSRVPPVNHPRPTRNFTRSGVHAAPLPHRPKKIAVGDWFAPVLGCLVEDALVARHRVRSLPPHRGASARARTQAGRSPMGGRSRYASVSGASSVSRSNRRISSRIWTAGAS